MNLAGLTLDAVLGKRAEPPPPIKTNTFLDVNIQDDASIKDNKSWKLFRDKLRLKRAGSAWISSIRIPESDVNVQGKSNRGERAPTGNPRAALLARRSSVRFGQNPSQVDDDDDDDDDDEDDDDEEEEEEEDSVDAPPPSNSFNPQRSIKGDDSYTPAMKMSKASSKKVRTLSAREAVAAQEAAEAAAAKQATAENTATSGDQEPTQMSLMDLLGDMGEDDDECDDEEEGEEEAAQAQGVECNCCVCKVKFTSSTFMPCGHVLCRLCSKELSVERGDCSLCDGFILEILEIF